MEHRRARLADPSISSISRRRLLSGSVALAVGAATGCSGSGQNSNELNATIVEPPFTVASRTLQTTAGEPFSMPGDFRRPLNILFFGYTNCPDICPAVMGSLAVGLLKLDSADRDKVGVYFVTTDPQRDTGAVLDGYLERLDPAFVGLTGALENIAAVGKSVGIYVDEGEQLPSGGYDPNAHSTYVMAVRYDGQAPAFWDMDTSPSQFAADIERLLG